MEREKGATLIEAVGALVVLSVLVLGFLGVSQYRSAASHKSAIETSARQVAAQELQAIRAVLQQQPTSPWPASPTRTYPGFTVTVHPPIPFDPPNDPVYTIDTSAMAGFVTDQALVYFNGQPSLLTVFVSWE